MRFIDLEFFLLNLFLKPIVRLRDSCLQNEMEFKERYNNLDFFLLNSFVIHFVRTSGFWSIK